MILEVGKSREIILKEVYNGISLETADGEKMFIEMRDSGFEFVYNGVGYSAQEGKIRKKKPPIMATKFAKDNAHAPEISQEIASKGPSMTESLDPSSHENQK